MTSILSIDPQEVLIGGSIQIEGNIDTPGGAFSIWFDNDVLHQGTCLPGSIAVSHGSVVPQTPPILHYIKLVDDATSEWDRKHFRVKRPGSAAVDLSGENLPIAIRRMDTGGAELERVDISYDISYSRRTIEATAIYTTGGNERLRFRATVDELLGFAAIAVVSGEEQLHLEVPELPKENPYTQNLSFPYSVRTVVSYNDVAVTIPPSLDTPDFEPMEKGTRLRSAVTKRLVSMKEAYYNTNLWNACTDLQFLLNDAGTTSVCDFAVGLHSLIGYLPGGQRAGRSRTPAILNRSLRAWAARSVYQFHYMSFTTFGSPATHDYPAPPSAFEQAREFAKSKVPSGGTFYGFTLEMSGSEEEEVSRTPTSAWATTVQAGGTELNLGFSTQYWSRTVDVTYATFEVYKLNVEWTEGHWLGSLFGMDYEDETYTYKVKKAGSERTVQETETTETGDLSDGMGGKLIERPNILLTMDHRYSTEETATLLADARQFLSSIDPNLPQPEKLAAYQSALEMFEAAFEAGYRDLTVLELNGRRDLALDAERVVTDLQFDMRGVALEIQSLGGYSYVPQWAKYESYEY